jgi:hypothetical protein
VQTSQTATDLGFGGIVLDRTAGGIFLSNRGKYATSVLVFGCLGLVAGLVFYTGGGSDREVAWYFFAAGGTVAALGLAARYVLRRGEESRAHRPRVLEGILAAEGTLVWGQCQATFAAIDGDGAAAIVGYRVDSQSPPDPQQALLRLLIVPLMEDKLHHLARITLSRGDERVGEATKDESGLFYLLEGCPAARARPLPIRHDAESGDISRTCVRNLRAIATLVSARSDLKVRVAIAYPKAGAVKWGLMLGLVGGLIAAGLESRSRDKLQRLLEEGGLRDSSGSLLELVERHAWEVELV